MKKNTRKHPHLSVVYPHYERPYPNAADPQYFIDKLVDGALAVATSMGTLTIIFFLITL
jgi:hypothetical protein